MSQDPHWSSRSKQTPGSRNNIKVGDHSNLHMRDQIYKEENHPLYVPPRKKPGGVIASLVGLVALAGFMYFWFASLPKSAQNAVSNQVFHQEQAPEPQSVLDGYCWNIKSRAWEKAYDSYSSFLKAQVSFESFVNQWSESHIDTCDANITSQTEQEVKATVIIVEFFTRQKTDSTFTLIQEQGTWKINSIQ